MQNDSENMAWEICYRYAIEIVRLIIQYIPSERRKKMRKMCCVCTFDGTKVIPIHRHTNYVSFDSETSYETMAIFQ